MNTVKLESSEYTPEVVLDIENNQAYFRGECRPENVSSYFQPIIEWFEQLKETPPQKPLQIVFNLDYFNSSSAKYIMDIIFLISDANEKASHPIEIVWEYDEDDEDVYEAGVEFEELSGVKFVFKPL